MLRYLNQALGEICWYKAINVLTILNQPLVNELVCLKPCLLIQFVVQIFSCYLSRYKMVLHLDQNWKKKHYWGHSFKWSCPCNAWICPWMFSIIYMFLSYTRILVFLDLVFVCFFSQVGWIEMVHRSLQILLCQWHILLFLHQSNLMLHDRCLWAQD